MLKFLPPPKPVKTPDTPPKADSCSGWAAVGRDCAAAMREPEMVASSSASACISLNCFIKSGPLVPDTYAVDIRILPIFSSWDAAAAKKRRVPWSARQEKRPEGGPGQRRDEQAARGFAGRMGMSAGCGGRESGQLRVAFQELAIVPVGVAQREVAGGVEPGNLLRRETPADGAEVLPQLLLVARADDCG